MGELTGLRFAVEDDPAAADVEVLPHRLEAFNERAWPEHPPWQAVGVFAREADAIVAGLVGETYLGWLFVRYLWVSEHLRGQGIGHRLLGAAEARAVERGCHSAYLDTYSFQAPEFYRKQGYEVFGQLDVPPAHQRIFLRKHLTPSEGSRG